MECIYTRTLYITVYCTLYSICVEFKSIIVNINSNNNTVNLFKVMFYSRTFKLNVELIIN